MPRKVDKKPPLSAGGQEAAGPDAYEQAVADGTKVVVLHPGSYFLRLGKPLDPFPQSLPHVIAIRRPKVVSPPVPDDILGIPEKQSEEAQALRESSYQSVQHLVKSLRTNTGSRRQHVPLNQLLSLNDAASGMLLNNEEPIEWTDLSQHPDFVIGDEALHVEPGQPYELHWPFRFGDLNIGSRPGQFSRETVCCDLERIWSAAIQQYLEISEAEFPDYSVVLLVPDIIYQPFVRDLVDVVLRRLRFAAVIVQQESVCSMFGAGLSSACVVDVGDQKVSICCVDDGLSQPCTRLRADYGGRDVTRCFSWVLEKIHFPYRDCSLANRLDCVLLTQLKEALCHMDPDLHGLQSHDLEVHTPGKHVTGYTLKLGDEGFKAALGLFYPTILAMTSRQTIHVQTPAGHDPEDLFNDSSFAESQTQSSSTTKVTPGRKTLSVPTSSNPGTDNCPSPIVHTGRSSSPAAVSSTGSSESSLPSRLSALQAAQNLEDSQLLGLDYLVLASIDACPTDEMKRRMLSSILLVGGTAMMPGMANTLRARLQIKLAEVISRVNMEVDVIANPKDQDSRFVCWKGGAVLSFLDTCHELWIRHGEWLRFGSQLLRERSPFVWS